MIVPTRFGLKYAPIPTLALEYEDDLRGVVDATGTSSTSLYVHRDGSGVAPPGPTRKLHVVELPRLTRTSETQQITRQLQQDNGRFLAPEVVSEAQLKRLLDRLVQNLPGPAPAEINEDAKRELPLPAGREVESVRDEEKASDSALDESMEESAMEESVAEASRSDEHEALPSQVKLRPERGAFLSHEGDEAEADVRHVTKLEGQDEHGDLHRSELNQDGSPPTASATEKEESEAEAEKDANKTKALRSESDVSDEDVQSEELEYFSEDGSDEDSF